MGKCTQEKKASLTHKGREWKNVGHAQEAAHSQIWLDVLRAAVKGKVAKVHGRPQVQEEYTSI